MAAMSPSITSLIPGANSSGSQTKQPANLDLTQTPAIGSSKTNPLMPTYPSGQAVPGHTSALNFPANTGGAPIPTTGALSSFGNPAGIPAGGGDVGATYQGLVQSGMRPGIANLFSNLLQSGLGYNPQVVKALLASLQPQINRGSAQLMEQFGGAGLGESSAAAIGMGDYLSNVALSEGQLISNLYEQSVNNYMQVLMGVAGMGEGYQATKMQTGGSVMGDVTGMISSLSGMFRPMKFPGTQAAPSS